MRRHRSLLCALLVLFTSTIRVYSLSAVTRNGAPASSYHVAASPPPRPIQVVVIGAGFSGLSTAYNLLKNNNNNNSSSSSSNNVNVQIIEARDRIGGRVYPYRLGEDEDDVMVDLGGQWVHEASRNNPIRRLMQDDLQIDFVPMKRSFTKNQNNKDNSIDIIHPKVKNNVLFDQDGRRMDAGLVKKATTIFYKALNDYECDDIHSISPTTSYQDLLQRQLEVETASDRRLLERFDAKALQRVLNYLTHKTEGYEGGRLHELSASLSDIYQRKGGPDRIPNGTYGKVLEKLQERLEAMGCRIQLNTPVHGIQYDVTATTAAAGFTDGNGVTLSIESSVDGDLGDDINGPSLSTIHCDYCVCTIPLGVLKQRRIQFDPPLPSSRVEAIEAMGMGLLNKIVLKFDSCFWGNLKQFGMAHDDPKYVKTFYDCSDDILPNSKEGAGGGGVLFHFLAGEAANRVERVDSKGNSNPGISDEDAIAESMRALRSIFGEANVPEPTVTKVTRWRQDPYSCGSYCFTKVGCTEDMFSQVAAPLGNLLFAGEHTSKTTHSTVHGAWETGEREAQRILALVEATKTS